MTTEKRIEEYEKTFAENTNDNEFWFRLTNFWLQELQDTVLIAEDWFQYCLTMVQYCAKRIWETR